MPIGLVLAAWQSPRATLRWFRRFCYAFIPLLALGTILEWYGDPNFDPLPAAWLLVVALAIEGADYVWTRYGSAARGYVMLVVIVTLGELAAGAWVLRAGDHPGLDMLVQFVIPCALTLRSGQAWSMAVVLILVHNGLVTFGPRLGGVDPDFAPLVRARHAQQMFVFDISVLALTSTVIHFRMVLNDREAKLHAALEDRARDDRLVALGILSAGIAHELGTPLSSIDMLAGEALDDPAEAAVALRTLRGQVQRCREILDRVRGTTAKTVSAEVEAFGPALRQWVSEWQGAGLDRGRFTVEVAPEAALQAVAGDPDTWRGVLWSLLDNAARAGGPISVRVDTLGVEALLLEIDDSGPGPSPDALARAGQAFFSSWGDGGREGRGLALFVATSFARRWGGDLRLARRPGGGARVTVRLATIRAEAG